MKQRFCGFWSRFLGSNHQQPITNPNSKAILVLANKPDHKHWIDNKPKGTVFELPGTLKRTLAVKEKCLKISTLISFCILSYDIYIYHIYILYINVHTQSRQFSSWNGVLLADISVSRGLRREKYESDNPPNRKKIFSDQHRNILQKPSGVQANWFKPTGCLNSCILSKQLSKPSAATNILQTVGLDCSSQYNPLDNPSQLFAASPLTSILHGSSPPPGTRSLPDFSTRCFYPSSPNHCGKWLKLLIHTFSIIILNQLILRNRWRSFWVGKGLQSLGLQLLQSSILRKRLTVFTAILIPPRVILALKDELLDFKIAIFPIHGLLELHPPCTPSQLIKMGAIFFFSSPELRWVSLQKKKTVSVIISSSFCHETSNKDCAKLQGEDLSYITRSFVIGIAILHFAHWLTVISHKTPVV